MGNITSIIPFIIMGMTSMLLQITVLRLLLSTFSGNELDIGITLSFWLIWIGLGSFTGVRVKLKHAFTISFILIALLALPTALSIKAIRPALALEPGESTSFVFTILSTAVSLFPLCLIIGLQFPLAVLYSGGRDAAGRVYGLEAIGAFIGGVIFTFVISGRIGAMELCVLLSLINILMAVFISKKKLITFLFILPLSFYLGFHKIAASLPWPIEPFLTVESRYGEIAVIKVREQASIYVNGQIAFSYPEPQTEELRTHLSMALHPSPSRILVVGGSIGTLKEFLKYPIEGVDFIELDPRMVKVSQGILSINEDRDAVKDRKVRIIVEDGRRFIKKLSTPTYDLIVLNLPQPSTASTNRFYTSDFFREAKKILKEDGILAMTIYPSTGYIGRGMQMASGSIYNSLRSAFKYVEVTAQEYGGLFASGSPINTDPEILEERFIHRPMNLRYFNQYIFRDAFSPFKVDYVRKRLGEIKVINTDLQPSAYLYSLMLWAEVHGGEALKHLLNIRGWHIISLLTITLISISFLAFRRKRKVIYYSIFTTGFSGMSFMLAVILAYQAAYGYIYEMIGMLTATFMIGLWAGTYLSRHAKKPLIVLLCLEIMTIILALSSSVFFSSELFFYLLCLLAGAITGGQFSTANLFIGELQIAGRLYGLDIIGSFLGAFIPSMIFIPLFGVYNALLFIVAIKAVSAMMILSLFPSFLKRG